MPPDIHLRPETPRDRAAVERLYATAFGPGRYTRTAFLVRRGVPHDPATSVVAERRGLVIGAVRQTPMRVGGMPAFLLGPLAVAETAAKQGIGRALMRQTLAAARAQGVGAVVLIGDEPFYGPHGFRRCATGSVLFGAPVEDHRLLALPLPAMPRGRAVFGVHRSEGAPSSRQASAAV